MTLIRLKKKMHILTANVSYARVSSKNDGMHAMKLVFLELCSVLFTFIKK